MAEQPPHEHPMVTRSKGRENPSLLQTSFQSAEEHEVADGEEKEQEDEQHETGRDEGGHAVPLKRDSDLETTANAAPTDTTEIHATHARAAPLKRPRRDARQVPNGHRAVHTQVDAVSQKTEGRNGYLVSATEWAIRNAVSASGQHEGVIRYPMSICFWWVSAYSTTWAMTYCGLWGGPAALFSNTWQLMLGTLLVSCAVIYLDVNRMLWPLTERMLNVTFAFAGYFLLSSLILFLLTLVVREGFDLDIPDPRVIFAWRSRAFQAWMLGWFGLNLWRDPRRRRLRRYRRSPPGNVRHVPV